jgi:type VI secretion system secreted protein VgrG
MDRRLVPYDESYEPVRAAQDRVISLADTNIKVAFAANVPGGFDVRHLSVREPMSGLFEVDVLGVSEDASLDLDVYVGSGVAVRIGTAHPDEPHRFWAGVVAHMAQVSEKAEQGMSAYRLIVAPSMWRMTLRRNCRIFEHQSTPEIVLKVLSEWGITPIEKWAKADYKKHEYCVQYRESDYAFVSRLLEEAGIAFYFQNVKDSGKGQEITKLVLNDAPHKNELRKGPLPYVGHQLKRRAFGSADFVASVGLKKVLTPGRLSVRDFDFRLRPDVKLLGAAAVEDKKNIEVALEHYEYRPGEFWWEGDASGKTPVADDKGTARTLTKPDDRDAEIKRELRALRAHETVISLLTNAIDLGPGAVIAVNHQGPEASNHPHAALSPKSKLLVTEVTFDGHVKGEWVMRAKAVFAADEYRPERKTPKPKMTGLQSALVVGPPGDDIYTDEFGRVRVQFPWDREHGHMESASEQESSCWMRVSEAWAGGGFGTLAIPRVGHEVLVDFFEGDPDRPVIVGRVHNGVTPPAYRTPANRTVSYWRSDTANGGGGYNEISFDDRQGKELIRIQAQKNMSYVVNHHETQDIGAERTVAIGTSDTLDVGTERTELVGKMSLIDVGKLFNIKVGESTELRMEPGKIQLTTGDASLDLGGSVAFHARGEIHLHSHASLDVSNQSGAVTILAGGIITIQGGPNVYINPEQDKAHDVTPAPAAKADLAEPMAPAHGLSSGKPFRPSGKGTVEAPGPLKRDVDVPPMAKPLTEELDKAKKKLANAKEAAKFALDQVGKSREEIKQNLISEVAGKVKENLHIDNPVAKKVVEFGLDHAGQNSKELKAAAIGDLKGALKSKLPFDDPLAKKVVDFGIDHAGESGKQIKAAALSAIEGDLKTTLTDKAKAYGAQLLKDHPALKYPAVAVAAAAIAKNKNVRDWAIARAEGSNAVKTVFNEAGERIGVPKGATSFLFEHAEALRSGDYAGIAKDALAQQLGGGAFANQAANIVLEKITGQPVTSAAIKQVGAQGLKVLIDKWPAVASGPSGDAAVTGVTTGANGAAAVVVHDGVSESEMPHAAFEERYDTVSSPGLDG